MADNDWAAEVNGDGDEDEALRIAIALSLGQDPNQQPRQASRKEAVVDLTQDDADDDDDDVVVVAAARSTGRHDAASGPVPPQMQASTAQSQQQAPSATSSALSGLVGLDRKKMEEERLARLQKRKAAQLEGDVSSAPRPSQRPRIAVGSENSTSSQPSRLDTSAAPAKGGQSAPEPQALPSSTAASPVRLPFPRGVVKKTWAFGQPRQGDDIKIEEVLQKHQLELAVLSSYQWDEEWLLSRIDLAKTKLILVAYAVDDAQKEEMRNNVPRDRIRFCFPPMQRMGAMHSKLMLLKYDKYMRIVVPTGNLMSFDWGETGTMENMAFIIDLPKLQTFEEREAQEPTPFGEELLHFLRAQGLDDKLVNSLLNYDFCETRRYHFVHTIPGSHTTEEVWTRTGYCGLGRAVDRLGLGSSQPIELDYVCASLGAVDRSLLIALYFACQGDSGLREYSKRTAGIKGKISAPTAGNQDADFMKEHTRVYFPSQATVVQSKGGKDGAGTICFQSRWWHAPTFPREVLRDCVSRRQGLVMHSKIIYVRPGAGSSRDSVGNFGFAYVGSANLSESAWGRLVQDRNTGKPKLTCRNWECGVLVKVDNSSCPGTNSSDGSGLGAFDGVVPVPMEWPGRRYIAEPGSQATMTPWFFRE